MGGVRALGARGRLVIALDAGSAQPKSRLARRARPRLARPPARGLMADIGAQRMDRRLGVAVTSDGVRMLCVRARVGDGFGATAQSANRDRAGICSLRRPLRQSLVSASTDARGVEPLDLEREGGSRGSLLQPDGVLSLVRDRPPPPDRADPMAQAPRASGALWGRGEWAHDRLRRISRLAGVV